MHLYLNVLLEWANNDPRWGLLGIIGFGPYGFLTLPKATKKYGNKTSLFNPEGKAYIKKITGEAKLRNSYAGYDILIPVADLTFRQSCVGFGVLFFFCYFNMWGLALFMFFFVPIVYSVLLFQYYFRWTDKGYKFQEEEKKKKEEKEQKKKEEDEARRKKYL